MWLAESIRRKRLVEARFSWTRQQVLDHQKTSLRDFLRHVWTCSPFYRDYYEQHGIQEKHLPTLAVSDLPILNKEIVVEGFDHLSMDLFRGKEPLQKWLHGCTHESAADLDGPGRKVVRVLHPVLWSKAR